MLELLALLLAFTQIGFDYRIRSPFISFSASFLAVVVAPAVFLVRDIPSFSENYTEGLAYILLFQIAYLTGSMLFRRNRLGDVWNLDYCNLKPNELNWAYFASISLALISFIYGISQFDIYKLLYLNWWDVVHSESVFTLIGSYFLYAASSILLVQNGTKSKMLLFASILFLFFAVFILKTRGYLVALISPIFLFYLFKKRDRKMRHAVILLIILSGTIAAFIFARMIRHGGDLYSVFSQGNQGLSSLFESAVSDGSEFSLINAYFYFVNTNFSQLPDGFGEFQTIRRLLFFFLPTGLMDLKPQEFSYVMYVAYYGGSMGDGLSMHPTIVGDAYANGRMLGVLIYPLLISLFFSAIERVIKGSASAVLFIGPACFLSIYFARGAVYNGFVFFIGAILLIYSFLYASRIKTR